MCDVELLAGRHALRGIPLPAALSLVFAWTSAARSEEAPQRADYERFALTHSGDADRGRRLFADEQRTRCSVCHRVGETGAEIGPPLTSIGGKFDRPHLIESLLEPSRQIVEGYRTSVLVLDDGRSLSGVIREVSPEELTLFDAEGRKSVVAADCVVSRTASDVSLMPEGLTHRLTTREFTDLIAYLESLRPGQMKMGAGVSGPISLPTGFEVTTVATGLSGATALETTPDGRVLVCEQTGALRVIRDGRLLEQPFVTLPVEANWERGLTGVTVGLDFPNSPEVYVCYVAAEPYPHHVISRFTAVGDVAAPDREQVLLRGDDQRQLGGKVPAGHQGGALHFGPDGCLYVAIGEQTEPPAAQRLDTLQGKILRLHPDGMIPEDNPFVKETTGKYRAIWARGCRNPFTFAFHPVTGEMLINDVGGKFEEINRGVGGANFGWPIIEHGPNQDQQFAAPLHSYPQSSICGGDFVPANTGWPPELHGRYLFADFVRGWIRSLDEEGTAADFAHGLRRPVDLRFDDQGRLYVLLRNAWVLDDKFQPGTSSVLRIAPTPPATVESIRRPGTP